MVARTPKPTHRREAVVDQDPVYTLHYFPFSIYSLMAKFGFVLGQRLNPDTAPRLDVKLVNLHRGEHLSEPYLTSINTKGQVPALTSPALPRPLDDSRDIANWLCQKQPELLPREHEETISRIMSKLYSFHAAPLVLSSEDRQYGIANEAAARLEQNDISEDYRRALEIKSVFHESTHGKYLDPHNVDRVEEDAQDFVQGLTEVLEQYPEGTWIFGNQPTILDAYTTALLARLIDVERHDLLSKEIRDYARRIMATPEWKKVTHGRPTIWEESMGQVSDLYPL